MPLHLHRAPRADLLADALAERLATPAAGVDDPFASELVIVPAKGVERWLSQRLSHRLGTGPLGGDGVCAGVEFRSPRSLVAEVVGTGEDDPWSPDALVWPLLAVVDSATGEPWCRYLDQHLGAVARPGDDEHATDLRRGRRYAVAHRLARLFASYAVQRPSVLAAWESGTYGVDTDGTGAPVPSDLDWQPELWRRLVAAVGQPSPVVRHRRVVDALRTDPASTPLPQRFSLFGHTRLPETEADLLSALAEHREVDVWLPHPSAPLWAALTGRGGIVPRDEDDSHLAVEHPLLATLGRDVRELERVLGPRADSDEATVATLPVPATLLGALQADLTANRAPDRRHVLVRGDRSVQVHACHGASRQVEVLREVVLGLLADDPTLEPRDVLVMCPDIETFAPLIEATFGLGGLGRASQDWHPGQQLQVRLADRALVQTNPLLAVLERLLDLAGGRAEASRVLDLAGMPPVRRRFGFTDDDLEQLGSWVDEAGVRWAFDAEHRRPYGLQDYVQNTWRFGLDRLLTGVAVSADADRWYGTTLPLDDVGSTSIDLAGRLAELVDRLQATTDRLVGAHPVDHWLDALADGLSALTAVGRGDEWQTGQAQRELAGLAVSAEEAVADGAASSVELRLPDVRALLADRLAGRPTRANFRTGSLTVCTMVPMRSVPHRVVCLLGLDDGVFPRSPASDGDDLLARHPLTGERDARGEDRQLMLDAVMAATEHLVVTYSGADETTGQPRPPAVPLGELLDALDLTATLAPDADDPSHPDQEAGIRGRVRLRHPLQRFDRDYLVGGALPGTGVEPFSFDPAALAGARAARERGPAVASTNRVVMVPDPLPALPPGDVQLEALERFLRHPVREFFRSRLDVRAPSEQDEVLDGIPVELDSLGQWQVADRMLGDLLRGRSPDDTLQLEWRRGFLPPGRLGWRLAQAGLAKAVPVAEKARELTSGMDPRSLDVDVDLGDGRRLRGTVTDLYDRRVVKVGVSRLGPRHHLDAWLPLLALCASWPDGSWSAGSVGRGSRRGSAERLAFGRVEDAGAELRRLVRLYDAGMREPIPLPLKTGHAYARSRSAAAGAAAAQREWSESKYRPEWEDVHHVLAWGPAYSLDELMAVRPLVGEEVAGHDSRFGSLAAKLWTPVLRKVVHG